jgi:putative membrane protein
MRPINRGAMLKMMILLGFALFLGTILITGDVTQYVHPRNIPFIAFGAAVMAVLACFYALELFRPGHKKTRALPLLFFVVPLLMAFALPAQAFDSESANVGSVSLQNPGQGSAPAADSGQIEATPAPTVPQLQDTGPKRQDGAVVMDNDNFYPWLETLYDDTGTYVGKRIEVVGFVYRDAGQMGEGAFVPARLMMVCCAADMTPVGLLCLYDGAGKLEQDAWVKVTGTVGTTTLDGETIPCIENATVQPADAPAEDYIYPF